MGAILVLQIAPVLMKYGAEAQTAKFVTVGLFRETGPLIAAIVLTGFAGASITAELATMAVNAEIAALRSQAIHPMAYLVVPRLVATAVMTFCLVILSDLVGLVAASLTAWLTMGSDPLFYFFHAFEVGEVSDFYTGITKGLVFGLVIGAIACRIGITASGSARDVGQATTRTVVTTVVALILVDLAFTAMFFGAGLLGI
jgi:phospholipid/cholesterol/gamma-HCH transport system permease protein